ncbi:hypothetical protein KAH37_04505 [bacterium]|nr:hypothetical protein [bacterium]
MRALYVAVFVMVIFLSCGNKTSSLVDDESPDTDSPPSGHSQPADSFFEKETANTFIFDFKGLVNSDVDISAQKGVSGVGDFTFYFGDDTITLGGDKNCYRKKYADDYEKSDRAGKEFMQLSVYSMKDDGALENGNSYYHYDYLSLGLSVDELIEAGESEKNELAMSELAWVTLYEYFVVSRADKRYFMQYCPLSRADNAHSKFFIDYDNNDSFSVGENMLFWGNIALSELQTVSEELRIESCLFFDSDGNSLTKEQFDAEIAKTGTEFSCDIPDGFFDKNGEDYLKFKFRGQINGSEGGTTGYTEFAEMEIGEELYHAGNYTSSAGIARVVGRSTLYAQMVGDYELINNTTAEYSELQVYVPIKELEKMRTDGLQELQYSSENIFNFFAVFHKTKYMEVAGQGYIKSCPIGVLDKDAVSSKLFICIDEDSDFSTGNEIEIAGRVSVTNDATKIAEYYADNGCICYAVAGDEEITCDDFAAMEK